MTDVLIEPGDSPGNFRSRPIVSCLNCRRKKQKCDRRQPCNSCIRSGRPSSCHYAPGQEPTLGGSDEETHSTKRRCLDSREHNEESQVTVASFNELQERVGQLERTLQNQTWQIKTLIDQSAVTHEPTTATSIPSPSLTLRKKTWELSLYKPLQHQVCVRERPLYDMLIVEVSRYTIFHRQIGR